MNTTPSPQNTASHQRRGWPGKAMLMRLGATLAIPLLVACLNAADAPSQDSAKLPPIPVFTRAEMAADLEHLTVRLKRAWAYAEDKRNKSVET